jgi:hypothetical protein
MHNRNLILLAVGDFGGRHALASIGRWLSERGATLNAFYVSNVEQYLFTPDSKWRSFYENVGRLPLDSSSVFIRPTGDGVAPWEAVSPPQPSASSRPQAPGVGLDTIPARMSPRNGTPQLCPILSFLELVRESRIGRFSDVAKCVIKSNYSVTA